MGWIAGELDHVVEVDSWFVVDIGFAEGTKSCGILTVENSVTDKDNVDYAEMIAKFQHFIQGKQAIGLIIEAPLSVAFSKTSLGIDGNPVGRRGIEIEKVEKTKTRYWYVGAGAAVTLSALNFLYQIKNSVHQDTKVYIYEGLLSFKNSIEQSHCDDAHDLYEAIIDLAKNNPTKESILGKGQTSDSINMKFIGDYLGIYLENEAIPPVIKVNSKTSNSFHEFQQNKNK